MCMWFGCNPCVNFCYFFHFVNFVIFWPQILWKYIDSGYLVSAALHTILYWPFRNVLHVFSMVWRCECDLDIILELIFVTFSTLWTHFLTSDSMKVYRQRVHLPVMWSRPCNGVEKNRCQPIIQGSNNFYALTSNGPWGRHWNPSLKGEGFNSSQGAQQMLIYQKSMIA